MLGRHKAEARTAVFSPDGDFLFTGGEEQEIICWNLRLKRRAFNIGLQTTRLQFRAEGGQCAVMTKNGVLLHSFEPSVACRELLGDLGGNLRHAAFSPDGRWLAVGSMLRLGLWDLTREAPAAMAAEGEYPKPFFSPDGSELFACWIEKLARWRIQPGPDPRASPPVLTPLPVPQTARVYSGHFVSNSLVLGTEDGFEVRSPADIASDSAERFGTMMVSGPVSPNGQWMTAQFSRSMGVYQLSTRKKVRDLKVEGETVAHVFTPQSDELAVVTTTGVTILDTNRWEPRFLGTTQWEPRRALSAPLDRNAQLVFMPDGHTFWLARDARNAALHDTQTFETLLPLPSGMTPEKSRAVSYGAFG